MLRRLFFVGIIVSLAAAGGWIAPVAAGNPRQEDGALPLTETYTLKSDYSFSHPAGWVTAYEMNEPGLSLLILGSRDDVAKNGGFFYDFQPGDVYIDFHWEALGNFSGVDATSSPVDVLNASIIGYYPDMGDAQEVQLGSHTVALAEGVHESGLPMQAVFAFWDEDTIVWYLALTAPGDYEQFKPTLLAIAESALPGAGESAAQPDDSPESESGPGPLTGALSGAVTGSDTGTDAQTVPVPTSIDGPEDCYNVAASIGDYSSEYGGADYAPVNLLDNNSATGWSSAGDVGVEYVTINLNGLQTVYGVLFNSYSPSPRYETDSIKDFSIEAILPDGSTRIVFKGEAAFVQGYQSYLFDPVETDQVRFIFSSTHGGGYYEAADIMVCALEGGAVEAPTTGMPPFPDQPEIRQWASRAEATSQYSSTDWSAQQATGAPDTEGCGDSGTAWASSSATGVDTLTVFFNTPVIPTRVHIYQTYNPGAITSVELIPAGGGRKIQVPDSADRITGCPGTFTVDVPEGLTGDQPVIGVAIRLDQTNHTGWNEIDAVELVGTAAAGAVVPESASADQAPLPAEIACDIRTRNRVVNMRGGPGTNFNVAGQLRPGAWMSGNGQTTGSDGFTWWRLTYGGWVRGDVVDAASTCSTLLPHVTADDPLPLTQRFTTPDGFSFDYPQDWVLVAEPGGAIIGNSWDAANRRFGDSFNPGEFQASIRWTTVDELAPGTGLAAGAAPMQVLRAAISVSSGLDMNEPYELRIGDQVVAAAYGTFVDMNVEIAVVIFDAGNGLYGSMLTGSDLRGLEQFEPTLRAIIASALD